jgi:hypothetical protein
MLGCLSFTAAVALLGFGCATQPQHSFNADFNQTLPTAPNYYIEEQNTNSFKLTVSQGKATNGQERIFDVKTAANTIAEHEAKTRGWQNWRLDYIAEFNDGWMHVVKVEVVRKQTLEFKGDAPANKP